MLLRNSNAMQIYKQQFRKGLLLLLYINVKTLLDGSQKTPESGADEALTSAGGKRTHRMCGLKQDHHGTISLGPYKENNSKSAGSKR